MADYTVQAGDTLSKIAMAHGTTVEKLAKENNIKNVNNIEIGQELSLGKTQAAPLQKNVKPETQMTGMDGFQRENAEPSLAQTYAPLAYGMAGAAIYEGGKYVLPKAANGVKKGAAVVAKKSKETASAVKSFVSNKAQQAEASVKSNAASANKKAQKVMKQTVNKGKKLLRTATKTYKRSNNLLNGKRVQVNGSKIKLGRAGRVLGKAAVPLAIAAGVAETSYAYAKGGTKAAVKQGVKCAAGVAGGWAGAKLGAAIGTAVCPGIGTAIGGFAGGVAGYLLGEKLFS